MFQENRFAALLAPSPSKRSTISYTRNFLLSIAKVRDQRKLKLQREIRLKMACVFESSDGLLPSPYCDLDSVCQQKMPQDSTPKAPDNVNLLHKSSFPYLPPCRTKVLSSSTGSSSMSSLDGSLNGDISVSSECTSQEQAEPMIPDVQIQQEAELKSSNMCSTCIPGLILPDEKSLTAYDGPVWTLEVKIPDGIDSFVSGPAESNLTEDDLDLDSPTYVKIKNLVESVLDSDDDDKDDIDSESDLEYDDSLMDDIMAKLVQHGARVAHMYLSRPWLYSNQLNPSRDQQCSKYKRRDQQDHNCILRSSTDLSVYSLASHPCPFLKSYQHFPLYDHGDKLRRFGPGAGESMFQQGKVQPPLPALDEVSSCKEKSNPMQNCFCKYQVSSYDDSENRHPDSHGDGDISQVSWADLKASKFFGGFYK